MRRDNRSWRRRGAATALAIAIGLVAAAPAAALDIKLVTITVVPNTLVPAGTGTIRTDDGGIDCRVTAGAVSGTCSHSYATVSSATVTWILIPYGGSEVCLGELGCSPLTAIFDATYSQDITIDIWGFVAVATATPMPPPTPSPTSPGATPGPAGPTPTPAATTTLSTTAGPTSGPSASRGTTGGRPSPSAAAQSSNSGQVSSTGPNGNTSGTGGTEPTTVNPAAAAVDVGIVGSAALVIAGLVALALAIAARRVAPPLVRSLPLIAAPLVLVAVLGSIFASVPAAAADEEPHRLGRLEPKALYGSFGRIEADGTISVPGDRADSLEFTIDQRASWELRVTCDPTVQPFVRVGVQRLTASGWIPVQDSSSLDGKAWVGSCGQWLRRTWTSTVAHDACYRILVGFGGDLTLRTVFAPYDVLLQGSLSSTLPSYWTGSLGGPSIQCSAA
jgi:hypothetical protein